MRKDWMITAILSSSIAITFIHVDFAPETTTLFPRSLAGSVCMAVFADEICRELGAMASTLAPACAAVSSGWFHAKTNRQCSPILSAPFHQLPLQSSFAIARRANIPLLVVGSGRPTSSEFVVEEDQDEKPSTSSSMVEKVDRNPRRMRMWGNIAWWIVVSCSVPFSLYTLPFLYGDFEIYKHLTVNALKHKYELAGLHIPSHLLTWQVHAATALLFMAIGPFQFNTAFRNDHPVIHKRLGYTFAVCTIVTAVTGATTMREASELGPIAVGMTPFMSAATLISLAISIHAARRKQFQRHRRWMLRSAAIGYSVMYTRMLPVLIQVVCKVSTEEALDYSFPLSVALNSGLAEVYIRFYLQSRQDRSKAGLMIQQASHESTLTEDRSKKVS